VVDVVALGVIVVLAGLAVVVVEAHVPTAGILGLAGVLAAAAGIGLIIAGSGAALAVSVPVSAVLAVAGVLASAVVSRKVLAARAGEVRTGPTSMIGRTAAVRNWSDGQGQVVTDGTLWSARMGYGWEDPPPQPGQTVVVTEVDGLLLWVRRPHPWEVPPVWKPSSLSL
jgi:membrane-bound serine protease (ClpP class)